VPQGVLNIYRRAIRRSGVSIASGHHGQRPVALGAVIDDMVVNGTDIHAIITDHRR
jgi:hypothetical protein